jgi:hypothetical protein
VVLGADVDLDDYLLLEPNKLPQLKHFKFLIASYYLIGAAMTDRLKIQHIVEALKRYPELANLDNFTIY